MDKLKSHPLEIEVDRIVKDLGGDLAAMKHVTDTGTTYYFNWGVEAEIAVYLALPVYAPSSAQNLFRVEFVVGEIDEGEVGKILFGITLDMDLQRYTALRVVPRTKDHRSYQIVLQCVCAVDTVQGAFLGSTLLTGLELAEFYRTQFLIPKAA